MAFLVYTILRSAASTAGHICSCSFVSFSRRLMLAICASLSTLLERLVTRRASALGACAFDGSGFAVSPTVAASPVGSEIGASAVSVAAGWASAVAGQGGSAVAMPDKASTSSLSQCSTGITLAVENVTGLEGEVASADGNRNATISAGEAPTVSGGEGAAADRNDTGLKLTPKPAM